MDARQEDVETIEGIVKALYEVISDLPARATGSASAPSFIPPRG